MELKKAPKKRIGEILIDEGFLNLKDLEKALEVQKKEGGLIGGILVKLGFVSEENMVLALSKQLSIPYIGLGSYHINRNALKLIPKEVAERYTLFPFEQEEARISVAMADPLNQEALEAIEKRVPSKVQVFLALTSDILDAIHLYYGEMAEKR